MMKILIISIALYCISACSNVPAKNCKIVGDTGIEVQIACLEPKKFQPPERYNTCKFDHEYEETDCTLVA